MLRLVRIDIIIVFLIALVCKIVFFLFFSWFSSCELEWMTPLLLGVLLHIKTWGWSFLDWYINHILQARVRHYLFIFCYLFFVLLIHFVICAKCLKMLSDHLLIWSSIILLLYWFVSPVPALSCAYCTI